MMNDKPEKESDFLLFTSPKGDVNVEVLLKDETVWLTQKKIGELFGKERSVITKHLNNIFTSGELDEKSNVQKMHFSHSDKPMKLYNLDVIISVGYRVNSYQATQFRIWATKILKEYIIKGFVLDDERLKQGGQVFGKDYLNEAHISELNQIVSAYLDLAENRAKRQIITKMADWIEFLHNFLELSNYPILKNKGKVSALKARLKAEQEYEVYRIQQDKDYISDFDKEIKRISGKKTEDE